MTKEKIIVKELLLEAVYPSSQGFFRVLKEHEFNLDNIDIQTRWDQGCLDTFIQVFLTRKETDEEYEKRISFQEQKLKDQKFLELSKLKILMAKYPPEERL